MACAERRFAVVQEHVKQGNAIPRRTSIGGERQARRHDAHLPSGSQTGSQSRSFVHFCVSRRRYVARARSMRRWVAARARAGKTRESKRISSVARALQGARRKGRADRWQMERLIGRICNPMRLKPAAAGRRRARARGVEGGEGGCTKDLKNLKNLEKLIFDALSRAP